MSEIWVVFDAAFQDFPVMFLATRILVALLQGHLFSILPLLINVLTTVCVSLKLD